MNDITEKIRENHLSTWRKFWAIYNYKNNAYKGPMLWTTVILNILFIAVVSISLDDLFPIIEICVDTYLSVIPNLLGFNLGAYTLLIGLSSTNIIGKLSKGIEAGSYTFYQKASATFGFCVLLEAVAVIIAFLFKQIISIQNDNQFYLHTSFWLSNTVIRSINILSLAVLNFFGLYSILLIIMVVKNIFGLSQVTNFFEGLNNLKNEKK